MLLRCSTGEGYELPVQSAHTVQRWRQAHHRFGSKYAYILAHQVVAHGHTRGTVTSHASSFTVSVKSTLVLIIVLCDISLT